MLNSEGKNKDNYGNNKIRAHLFLTGRVQGVAFRYYARNIARRFGVKGWIKNLANGDVEVIVEGEQDAVKKMIEWCKKGPAMAIVENLKIDWLPCTGEFYQFFIQS